MKKFALVGLVALFVVGCAGKEPVTGMWKGSIQIPDSMKNDPKAQAATKVSPTLQLKDDKTYVLNGIPNPMTGASMEIDGKWTETDTQVSLTMEKVAGQTIDQIKQLVKAMPGGDAQIAALEKPIVVTISEDRKKLTMQPSAGAQGSIEFTR